jgi:hypothetical protein
LQAFIQPGRVYAREDLNTNGATPVTLTSSVYQTAAGGDTTAGGNNNTPRFAHIVVEVQNIRYTKDGVTTPAEGTATTSVGAVHGAATPYPLILTGKAQIDNFKFVAVAAGAARIHVDYYQ